MGIQQVASKACAASSIITKSANNVLSLFFTVRIKNTTYQDPHYAERMAFGDNAKRTKQVTIEEFPESMDFKILSLNDEELVLIEPNSFDSGQGSQDDYKFTFKKKR